MIKVVVATVELRVQVIVPETAPVVALLSCMELAETETTVVSAAIPPVPETPIPGVIQATEFSGRVNEADWAPEVVVVKLFPLTAMAPFEVARPIFLPSFTFVVSENPT